MSDTEEKPQNLKGHCEEFLRAHNETMLHHANFLEHIEQSAKETREQYGDHVDQGTPGMYDRQARHLREMGEWMRDVADGAKVKNTKPADRRELHEKFMHTTSAINMIIEEHVQFMEHLQAVSQPDIAEQDYREDAGIEPFVELDAGARAEIADLVTSNQSELRQISQTMQQLNAMHGDFLKVREAAIGSFPAIGGQGGGRGQGK